LGNLQANHLPRMLMCDCKQSLSTHCSAHHLICIKALPGLATYAVV